jgi:adenylate kinase family enzyme
VKLIRREDDNEEAVTRRIATFYHNTLPLVAEWAARWKRVYRIDAGKSIDDVFEHIKVILSAY